MDRAHGGLHHVPDPCVGALRRDQDEPLGVHEKQPEVQVLRIGDRLLLAAPGEPSVEMGRRFEATVRPENAASIRVLGKLGFREEGLFRRYLDVDGQWRDHLCFAITAEEPPTGGLVGRLVVEGRAERA